MPLPVERLNVRRATYIRALEDDALASEEALLAYYEQVRTSRRRGALLDHRNDSPALTQAHYRRFADSFAEDADGVVQGWNGIDKPWRFEAAVGSYETVGVLPPSTACTIGFGGSGNIVGQFYAYVRFVDRDGNYSSLSPISNLCTAQTTKGSLTGATTSSPIVISGISGLSDGQVIKITGVLGNTAANGVFNVKSVSGGYALFTDSSLTTGVQANGTYVSGGTVYTGASSIAYSNVPTPAESKVVSRQILRNQDGDLTVFYVDIDTEDLTSTTFTSNTDSESLLNSVSLADTNGFSLVDKSLPPTIKRFVAFHLGRMFAVGNKPYSEGACIVTSGSKTVTGIGTEWGSLTFADRFFEVIGGTKRYQIDYCSSATSLTLTEAYQGSTNAYANYTIHVGDGERRTFYFSEPAQPEAWPLSNTLTISEDPNNGEVTGLFSYRSFIYFTTEHRIWKFSHVNQPLLDGFIAKAASRGCINNRCWVQVEDAVYMLDVLGIHAFSGNDDSDIGTPAVQDMFRAQPTSGYKINWLASDSFHAIYSPGECVIRWFVSLGDPYAPYHAICFHVRLGRWWLEEYPWPVGASCIGRLNSRPQVYLGTTGARIMAASNGTLDGANPAGGTVQGNVTSAGIDWITDSAATHATSGLVGNPVVIVSGRGAGQRRIVHTVSSGKISVTMPWTTRPDTTSVYQLGGIQWHWTSGWLRWTESDYQGNRAIALQYKATPTPSKFYLSLYRDLADSPEEWENTVSSLSAANGIGLLENDPADYLSIDSTRPRGYVLQNLSAYKHWFTDANRYVSVKLAGVTNKEQLMVLRLIVYGAEGSRQ